MDDSPSQSSPADEGISSYGTPDGRRDSSAKSENIFGADNDANLVIGAGRSLKTMLGDLTSVLEDQAKAQVFLTGEMQLRISGREEYTLTLVMEHPSDPSSLNVKIDKTSSANGVKRKASSVDMPSTSTTPKKPKPSADPPPSSPAHPALDTLAQLSQQIHWVETCRRVADEAHDAREDTWRTTSATFHHDAARARDRHEAWLAHEMAWLRNMLIGLNNDVKGLYPLGHSLKWETPPSAAQPGLAAGEGEGGYPRYGGAGVEGKMAGVGAGGAKKASQMGVLVAGKKKSGVA